MLGGDLRLTDGAAAGAWIEPRLGGEFGAVTLQVPKDYEAYARVFHSASDPKGNPVSWAEVADAMGSTAHREMQWRALVGDRGGFIGSKWPSGNPSLGAMELPVLDALCEVLAAHTTDAANCFFGLCTIERWEDAFTADELTQPLLKLPAGRDHIVLTGPLSAVQQIIYDRSKVGEGPPPDSSEALRQLWRDPPADYWREAPNLIWPVDRAWLVASEVDFDSTLVGGSTGLIQAIVESRELEAWQVEPDDSLAIDADKINLVGEEDS